MVVRELQKGSPWFAQTALIALDVRISNQSEVEFGGTDIFDASLIKQGSHDISVPANGVFRPQPLIDAMAKRRDILTNAWPSRSFQEFHRGGVLS